MTHADGGPHLIVFSDLDGTLLDHETYSWHAAKPAIDSLKNHGHSLILASSKTAAEIITIRADIGFEHCPAIVENGGGILPANTDSSESDKTHGELMARLNSLPQTMRDCFRGFSHMSLEEIVACTGLTETQAHDAAKRQFTEPGLFNGTESEQELFIAELNKLDVSARMGGRFLTLSFGQNKSILMEEIASHISKGAHYLSLALGDAPNDLEMLCAADRGFLILNPASQWQQNMIADLPSSVTKAPEAGPVGWNLSVLSVIDEQTA